MSTTQPPPQQLRNFFGLQYFNRETTNPVELTLASRFFGFPESDGKVAKVVNQWRSEDFAMKEDSLSGGSVVLPGNNTNNNNNSNGGNATNANNNAEGAQSVTSPTASTGKKTSHAHHHNHMVAGMKNKAKIVKQRNLALHLMNYSAHLDLKKTIFTVKNVQTFINVSETDDAKTVSHCMVAISNIASDVNVRTILFEINAMHKLTNMLQHLKGKAAHFAAAILFYYFSCDKDTEDRVYRYIL